MFLLFCASFLGAMLSTLPPGPLNLRLVMFHLKKQRHQLFCFQFGIIFVDACLSILAWFFSQKTIRFLSQFLPHSKIFTEMSEIIFICVLFGFSFWYIFSYFKKQKQILDEQIGFINLSFAFFAGAVGTLTIPGLVPFWYFWWISSSKFLDSIHPFYLVVLSIFVGVALGDSLVFTSYRYIADFFYKKNKDALIFAKLELVAGILFLFMALFFMIQFMRFKII